MLRRHAATFSVLLALPFAPLSHGGERVSVSAGASDVPRVQLCGSTIWTPREGTLDCRFTVARDAYVLVVAIDFAQRPHVVYPLSPDDSGFTRASTPTRVARINLGSARQRESGSPWRRLPSGVLVAIASDAPLRLESLKKSNGDWDEAAIGRLLDAVPGGSALVSAVTTKRQSSSRSWAPAHI
jgi:hypothetical protein